MSSIIVDTLKLIYGNGDIMTFVAVFTIFITLFLATKQIYEKLKL